MSICIECGDKFNPKRKALGYNTCLKCGEAAASEEAHRRSKCTAPAYNKGAYMYIGSSSDALCIGR